MGFNSVFKGLITMGSLCGTKQRISYFFFWHRIGKEVDNKSRIFNRKYF